MQKQHRRVDPVSCRIYMRGGLLAVMSPVSSKTSFAVKGYREAEFV